MFLNHRRLRVFLYRQAIDMRSGFEKLSYWIREEMHGDLCDGHLYLFLGKNRRRAKVLLFDGTGLVLIHKRLETGRFMRVEEMREAKEMTTAELSLLLDGSRIKLPMAASIFERKSENISQNTGLGS